MKTSLFLTQSFIGQIIKTYIRYPLMYALKPGNRYVVSVAMVQLITRKGIIDVQNCDIIYIEKISLSFQKKQEALSVLAKQLNKFINKTAIARDKIIGVGICMSGCNGFAGVLSHIPFFLINKLCSCGKR